MNNIIKNIAATVIAIAVFVTAATATSKTIRDVEAADTTVRTSVNTVSSSTATLRQHFKAYTCYIKHNQTVVRSEPNSEARIIKRLSLGKKITVVDKRANWLRVGKDKWVHANHTSKKDPVPRFQGVKLQYSAKYNVTKGRLTRSRGRLRYKGHTETWYSSKEPGQTRTAYHIPGKHLANDGTYRDKDGYICVAASKRYSKGAKLMTSLGPAKVYDRGVSGSVIDIYTNW